MKTIATLLLCIAAAVAGAAPTFADLPGFDFAYEIGGAAEATPVQVFDDGLHTYIQWPTNALKSGTRLSVRIDGKEPPVVSGPTPRLKVRGTGSIVDVQVGTARARASYVGVRGTAPMQRAVAERPAIAVRAAIRDAEQRAQMLNKWEVFTTDRTLDATLKRWAQMTGYRLAWHVADVITIDKGAVYNGTLRDALASLAKDAAIAIRVNDITITVTEN